MCCCSAAGAISARLTTATTFTTDSPSAEKRPASPSSKSTGKTSSPAVPEMAASCGDSSGTLYSSVNSSSVVSQSRILVRPERKNACAR